MQNKQNTLTDVWETTFLYSNSVQRGFKWDQLTLKTFLLSYPTDNNLSKHLKNHQLNFIRANTKLKFGNKTKIRNPEHRRVASKFRIGNHNLKIETGRFTIPKTPEDLTVENEMHILFHCDQYNDLRKTLFIKINDPNTLFTNYNIHDKVCFLFNNTDSHISRLTANFVFQAFERRKKHN